MAGSVSTEKIAAVVLDSARAAESLSFARGYLRALADGTSAYNDSQLRELKHLITEAVALAKDLGSRIKLVVEQSQDAEERTVRALLAIISTVKQQSSKLGGIRTDMIHRNPAIEQVWSTSDQTEIDRFCELFDEAEETLALGLSGNFRSDIHAARSEAGLANDGGRRDDQ